MKFPSALTAAGNAIRKLHRQSDQAEIIVCGEFIIHVKHDYTLRRDILLVSRTGMETGAKCATKFVKKVSWREIECHIVVFKDSVACAFYCTLLPVRLITSHYPFSVRLRSSCSLFQFCIIPKFLARRELERRKREETLYGKICRGTAVNSLKLALINERYVALRANFRQVRYNRKM